MESRTSRGNRDSGRGRTEGDRRRVAGVRGGKGEGDKSHRGGVNRGEREDSERHGGGGSPGGHSRAPQNRYGGHDTRHRIPGLGVSTADLSPAQMLDFLQNGLKIVEAGSAQEKQDLIRGLADERGLRRIRQILEADFAGSYSVLKPMFHPHCVLFLQLISHHELQYSLVLEKAVGTIYNIVYGHDGRRGVEFFRKVANHLLQERFSPQGSSALANEQVFEEALRAATAALFNTVNLNQGASDEHSSSAIRSAHQNVQRIKDRLSTGDMIACATRLPNRPTQSPALPFEIDVDLPGSLSREGPRHDNDHESIEKIKVLPTTQEIGSHRADFLPSKGTHSQHHLRGVSRLLDSQFRLLREDTTGQLRDAVRIIHGNWKTITRGGGGKAKKILRRAGTPLRTYHDIQLEHFGYEKKRGLEIDISFSQPRKVAGLGKKQRKEAWTESKELRDGFLLALVDSSGQATFLLVSQRVVVANRTTDEHGNHQAPVGLRDLASDAKRAMITLCLADPNSAVDQSRLVSLGDNSIARDTLLIEFPDLLFVSFEPILRCLQGLHKNPVLPFARWITRMAIDAGAGVEGTAKVPPPLYLVRTRATLDLGCIASTQRNLSFSLAVPVTVQDLVQSTTLDHGQAKALVSALQHELVLIQGPPGTGKSYIGLQLAKVLLANAKKTQIGPILCVCYTNHALDQFLEQLLDSGIEKIVRMGSRSKSSRLQNLSLSNYNKKIPRTQTENREVWQCMATLEDVGYEMEDICTRISTVHNSNALKNHLERNYPRQYDDLFSTEDTEAEGFTVVRAKGNMVDSWVRGHHRRFGATIPSTGTNRTVAELLSENIWEMSPPERVRLRQHWEEEMRVGVEAELEGTVRRHSQARHGLLQIYRESDKRCLEQAQVIGATTTGLASNSDLLRSISAKVLICEEAAEVLEAHVLTALLPSVEHAILIGDHLQLRPQVSYHLSVESERGQRYGLDESLFERLANERLQNGDEFPITQLNVQRRMHPSISSLVRNTLYPDLKDYSRTSEHPTVAGMRRRLFWLDHRHCEDASDDGEQVQTSRTNEWEANIVVALVRHLSRQGAYKAGQIAVITPYLGQLRKLQKKLGSTCELLIGDRDQEKLDLDDDDSDSGQPAQQAEKRRLIEGLRVATVDNFQGEEAAVVIVSLVRSNAERNCGFLKTSNRINVLLSRAQHGMYIVGNADTSTKVAMWAEVISMLEAGQNIGPKLELHCPRHSDDQIYVSEPEDFAVFAPEGGCSERCALRLNCGHACINKCHSDIMHNAVKCMEPCLKQFIPCGHSCPQLCYFPCKNCHKKIPSVKLLCGHVAKSLECHEMQDLATVKCQTQVVRTVPGCHHEVKVPCHTDIRKFRCLKPCGNVLPCGHNCGKPCWTCRKKRDNEVLKIDHGSCDNPCGRAYTTCPHICGQVCHASESCKPCDRPCAISCRHSRCSKLCSEPCPPCAENCGWSCTHREACNMPCAVPCDIAPCSMRCSENLSCGHQCPGICGERCPEPAFCQTCATPDVLQRNIDLITFETFAEVNLPDDPLVFLSCRHFYTVSSLDGVMELNKHYEVDSAGKVLGPKLSRRVASGTLPKGCPECRAPLRNVDRYNRIVKLALLDEATRRFVSHANSSYAQLVGEVAKQELALENERKVFVERWSLGRASSKDEDIPGALKNYQRRGQTLLDEVDAFTKSVASAEQPYGRINSMVIDASRRRNATSTFEFDETVIQTGFQFRAESLSLRLNWALLWDADKIHTDNAVNKLIRESLYASLKSALKALLKRCISLEISSVEAKLPQHEVEARIYRAQFTTLALNHQKKPSTSAADSEALTTHRRREKESLKYCLQLCSQLPVTLGYLEPDIEKALRLVGGGTFYSFVSTKEKQEVYEAMARQFSGTGHWYYCRNNHPFTVGECGMPMEEARCPQCGEAVGGRNHAPAAGVRRAADLEEMFGGLRTA